MSERDLSPADLSPGLVVGRAARGAVVLGARHVVVTLVGVGGGVALARLLSPEDFGVYAVVAFAVAALNVVGDGGLAVSLVREATRPSLEDYRAVFAVQQALVAVVVAVGIALAPAVLEAFDLGSRHQPLVWMLLGAALITSFQSVPSIELERQLRFGTIGTINVIESLTFTGTAVALALLGHGVFSFGVAALVQAAAGTVLLWRAAPWAIGWSWRPELVRPRLRFGVPFQGIVLVSFVKDAITPVLIGLVLGAAEVGYVKWAQAVAAHLLIALMAMDRVYFPTFSRLQAHPDELRRTVEAVIRVTNLLVAPVALVLVLHAEPIVALVYGDKWEPALGVLYWLCVANLIVPTATPMFSLLNALGRSQTALGFAVTWMVSTWVLGLPLIAAWGIAGFGVANALVQVTNLWLVRVANRDLAAAVGRSAALPWLLLVPVAGAALLARSLAPPATLAALSLHALAVVGAFVLLVVLFDRTTVARTLRALLRS